MPVFLLFTAAHAPMVFRVEVVKAIIFKGKRVVVAV